MFTEKGGTANRKKTVLVILAALMTLVIIALIGVFCYMNNLLGLVRRPESGKHTISQEQVNEILGYDTNEVQFDFDNGVAVYEVDFHADKVDYDYEINALTGKIIRAEKEKDVEFSDFALIKWIMSIIEAIKSFFNK